MKRKRSRRPIKSCKMCVNDPTKSANKTNMKFRHDSKKAHILSSGVSSENNGSLYFYTNIETSTHRAKFIDLLLLGCLVVFSFCYVMGYMSVFWLYLIVFCFFACLVWRNAVYIAVKAKINFGMVKIATYNFPGYPGSLGVTWIQCDAYLGFNA